MRERKCQFHLSLGIAVCVCLFLPLSVFAGEYVGAPAAEGSGISAAENPWQLAGICEPCAQNADCESGNCGIPVDPNNPRLCIPAGAQSYSCPAPKSDGGGCLIGTVANGSRMAE